MNILLAPDKFKGSMSALEVCNSIVKGLKKNNSNLNILSCPMADGGEGSLEIINHYLKLNPVQLTVNDPLFRPIKSTYYLSKKNAYIQMSSASGLILLKKEERNCMLTSSYGTGELILDSLKKGARSINLFIGGSATNDGGIGLASALGYRFFDSSGSLINPIGKYLSSIDKIDKSQLLFNPEEVEVKVVCDVNNPLYGKNGAAHVYASQKGASLIEIDQLNEGLINLASKLIQYDFPAIAKVPGAGAAGGVGGGAIAFLNAKLASGIQTFIDLTQLETLIKECDLVITGEGKLDSQTLQGKVVSGVCSLAKKHKKEIIGICGEAEKNVSTKLGFKKVYTILDRTNSVEEAIEKTDEYLADICIEILANEFKNKF